MSEEEEKGKSTFVRVTEAITAFQKTEAKRNQMITELYYTTQLVIDRVHPMLIELYYTTQLVIDRVHPMLIEWNKKQAKIIASLKIA